MKALRLYGTLGCHLCDVAEAMLAQHVDFEVFSVELIDIAESDDWVERYGVRIPVLADVASGAELGWPFGPDELARFLAVATTQA